MFPISPSPPAPIPAPRSSHLLLVYMGYAYEYIRSLVHLFSSPIPTWMGIEYQNTEAPEGGLTPGPQGQAPNVFPTGKDLP